jgi:hypothetical protein
VGCGSQQYKEPEGPHGPPSTIWGLHTSHLYLPLLQSPPFLPPYLLFFSFETGSSYVAQAGFELRIFLLLPPECGNYRWAPPYLASLASPAFYLSLGPFTCLSFSLSPPSFSKDHPHPPPLRRPQGFILISNRSQECSMPLTPGRMQRVDVPTSWPLP